MDPQGIPNVILIVIGVAALGISATLLVVRLTNRDRDRKHPPTMLPASSRMYAAVALLLGVGLAILVTMAARAN